MFETLHKSKQISVIALDRLGDYIELLRIELKLQGRELGMQLLGYVVAAFFGILTAIFIGVAIIVTFWDSPNRAIAAWGVVVLYVAAAGGGIFLSLKHKYDGSAFSTLRNELKRDVDLVKESI
ncbi:MAG: phage holin family protein [Herminiimonas sp.]|nr:phage holin family protein [Herminiimonas sp.]